MSVLKALRQRVAPELNFLLTDDPSERAGAIDGGWRPHLHAYHALLVARMFGAAAELRTGDIAVIDRLYAAADAVTAEDLMRAAKKYFVPERRNVIVLKGGQS
mgnify:CR=1 FL=1